MKKKVLHINSYYIARGFYFLLFEKLRKLGYDIKVFVFAQKGREIEHNRIADYIEISDDFSGFDRCFFHLKHLKVYKDLKTRYPNIKDYNIVHAHSLFSNGYIAYKIKREYGIPYIVAVRGTDINLFFKKMFFLRKQGIKILEEAFKIIFISPAHKKTVFDLYLPEKEKLDMEKKSIVIPNGIDTFWIENRKNDIRDKKNKLRLLYVGEINQNKNLILTCQAINNLIETNEMDISYSIVGKILDKNVFNELIKFPFVNYLGVMQKEQLLYVYNQNDIFIMVSKSETFGLVYAEALTQGLPLIYSKDQGFDGFFAEGFVGYSAFSNSGESISSAIKKVNMEYARLAANCIKVGNVFSWDEIVKKYAQIYEEIS